MSRHGAYYSTANYSGSWKNTHNQPDTQFSSDDIKTEEEEDAAYEEKKAREAAEAMQAAEQPAAKQRVLKLKPLPPPSPGFYSGKRRSKSRNKPKKSTKRVKTAKRSKSRKISRRHK